MSTNEIRRRKVKQHNDKLGIKKHKTKNSTTANSIHRSLLCLIISGSLLTGFIVLYTDDIPWYVGHRMLDNVAKQFGYHKPVYAVVIDAGSTGSRVLAFTFHESYIGGYLILDKELFEYNKVGLSSFAKAPEEGAAMIGDLLELAKKEIPREHWSKTPLVLRATAGLRLLPKDQAENLLKAVKKLFKDAPFLTDDKSVEIMDGTDEGIFSWFTVNFLLDRINNNPANTVAALDLGGGSTQVTFAAITPSSLKERHYIHQAPSPKGPISVYTHSYLGLGLKSARKEIITTGQEKNTNITSECINPIIRNKKFHYQGIDYFVSGLQKNYQISKSLNTDLYVGEEVPIVNFQKCSRLVINYVENFAKKTKPPEELPLKSIFAFSYYYDRASAVGLIDFSTGGQVKVEDFRNIAEKVCHTANAEQPFMCLDLTFIWVLLEKGFGLDPKTKIYLYKKIKGHEISWALGAAYDILRGSW